MDEKENTIKNISPAILETSTEFVPATIKNVLLCGASKSGKSTICNILQNPCYCPQNISLFPDTKFTSCKTFSMTDNAIGNANNLLVNLIDTPGSYDVRADGELEPRSVAKTTNIILACLNLGINYLNLLVLVLNGTKCSPADFKSIEFFINLFGETAVPFVLCLTHADSIGIRRRQEIEEELLNFEGLAKFFSKKLLTLQWMGCVNYIGKDYTDELVMFNDYRLVAKWRNEFFHQIRQAETRVELSKTSIYNSKKESCFELLPLVISELQNLAGIDILNPVGDQQIQLINNKTNMDFLYSSSFYLEKEKEKRNDLEEQINAVKDQGIFDENALHTLRQQANESNTILCEYSFFHTIISDIKRCSKPQEFKEILLSRWV